MSKKVIVIISIVLAIIFTFAVVRSTNVKYASLKKTVDIVKTTQYIPAGSEIMADQITTIKIPEAVNEQMNFVKNAADIVGKTAKVSLVKGQMVSQDTVDNMPLRPGMLEVHVPVDISSSAAVIAGDTVDVFATEKNQQGVSTEKIYTAARVLHSFDQSGKEISPIPIGSMAGPPGAQVPVSVALEVSENAVIKIITVAAKKSIYLAKTLPGN